jgi:CheY-like chemotaxis protein
MVNAKRPKIIIVEDNPDTRLAYEYAFAGQPYDVEILAAGTTAVRLVDAAHDDYAAILLDISMESLDGFTVAEEIRRNEANAKAAPIKIGFLTAYPEWFVKSDMAQQVGASLMLSKPADWKSLPQKLAEWIGEFPARSFAADEGGQDMVEYSFLLVLIGVGALLMLTVMGQSITGVLSRVTSILSGLPNSD